MASRLFAGKSHSFSDLAYPELRERAQADWLVVIPTGCTEQQGPHLPVGFDTWFAEEACRAGAELAWAQHDVGALVLPAMPFGPTPEHRNFGSGFIDIPQPLHEALLAAVLDSLAAQGFRRMVIWRGCGQHDLTTVIKRFNTERSGRARAFQPDFPHHRIWCACADPAIPGGHADSYATAIALHLRPESVRCDLIPAPELAPVTWDDPALDFARSSASGVIGDATHASAELGERLWRTLVADMAETLKRIAQRRLE